MTTAPLDLEREALALYRILAVTERRRIAEHASPDLRLRLAHVERGMALDRSPGALASVLTGGREMQAPHLDIIDRIYQRIAAGERLKVMVTMPPRAGKSRRTSRWGPVWYLRRQPDHRFMLASYAAHLADDHGRWVRNTITEHAPTLGIDLRYGSQAANRFDITGHEGGMVTAGVGGASQAAAPTLQPWTTRSKAPKTPDHPPCATGYGTGGKQSSSPASNHKAPSSW